MAHTTHNSECTYAHCRNFIYQLRRISSDAGMPVIKDPFFQRYVQGVDNVEPLFRQLRADRADLQLIMVVLPGKTPVYGECSPPLLLNAGRALRLGGLLCWEGSNGGRGLFTTVVYLLVYVCLSVVITCYLFTFCFCYPLLLLLFIAEVKRVGDTLLGVATQCVQSKNVMRPSPQTLSNLCLKINVKLGGINSILVPNIRYGMHRGNGIGAECICFVVDLLCFLTLSSSWEQTSLTPLLEMRESLPLLL